MATSGTYVFGVTRDDILRQAHLNIGKLDAFEVLDPVQTQDGAFVLNMMVKQWMGKADWAPGLKMWTRKHGNLFLSSTTGRYLVGAGATGWTNDFTATTTTSGGAAAAVTLTLASVTGVADTYKIGVCLADGSLFWTSVFGAPSGLVVTLLAALPSAAAAGARVLAYATTAQQPLFIETVILRDQHFVDVPVNVMTVQSYDFLPSKADPAFKQDPTAIYYENQLTNSYLYTDCGAAQDVTKHLVLTYQEPIQDFNNPTDNPHYSAEWYLPLCWGLSKLLCPQYNRVWTPLMEENFVTSLRIAQEKDAEWSELYFECGSE